MALEDAVSSHHHRYQTFLAHHESETDLLSSALVEAEERELALVTRHTEW